MNCFALSCVLVPLIIALYCCSFSKLTEVRFKSRYGAGLEGTNLAKKVHPKSILAFPVFFFGRRIAFAASAVLLVDFLWAQLAIQMTVSILSAAYLLQFRPLESSFSMRMEVMNESSSLTLIYLLFCLTDLVPDPEIRNMIGYVYMIVALTNVAVHLVMLAWDFVHKCKLLCKKQAYARRPQKVLP